MDESSFTLPERHEYQIIKQEDQVFVAMKCGAGVYRARHMTVDLFRRVGEMCRVLQEAGRKGISEREVPLYPRFAKIAESGIPGVCRSIVGAHRLMSGTLEFVIALYDEGDDEFPVLILVGDEIGEFIAQT